MNIVTLLKPRFAYVAPSRSLLQYSIMRKSVEIVDHSSPSRVVDIYAAE